MYPSCIWGGLEFRSNASNFQWVEAASGIPTDVGLYSITVSAGCGGGGGGGGGVQVAGAGGTWRRRLQLLEHQWECASQWVCQKRHCNTRQNHCNSFRVSVLQSSITVCVCCLNDKIVDWHAVRLLLHWFEGFHACSDQLVVLSSSKN